MVSNFQPCQKQHKLFLNNHKKNLIFCITKADSKY